MTPLLAEADVMPGLPWPYVVALCSFIALIGGAYVKREQSIAKEKDEDKKAAIAWAREFVPVLARCASALEAVAKGQP